LNSIADKEIIIEDNKLIPEIFGIHDTHLKLIEKKFNVRLTTRENVIRIKGEAPAVEQVDRLISQLQELYNGKTPILNGDLKFAIRLAADDPGVDLKAIFSERITVSQEKGFVTPKGRTQREFIHAARQCDIVLGIGPAGTGKTYLAVALAVEGLLKHQFKKIVLVRPAVEAGEKLGFLPGDIAEKINPYLMPLYDALNDLLPVNQVWKMIEDGIIEIAPLAYMRGRTLNDAFIILDEAQNSTREQMKMFLTRLGFRSKMVVTGDITQVDLSNPGDSGLIHAKGLLQGIEGIHFSFFTQKDVIRHDLVKKIIQAYETGGSQR